MSARRGLGRVFGRLREEAGASVAELTVTLALMLIVGVVAGTTLLSAVRATESLEEESEVVDELRVAMAQLEREFRSAECVREPLPVAPATTAASATLRFTTRSNGGSYEVTYSVASGALVRTEASDTSTIVDGLADPDTTFTYTETPRRSVDVVFTIANDDGDDRHLITTVAGRNAWISC